jgi:hypothetical protein
MVRDWLSCAAARKKGLQGAKPDQFNDWVLMLLNAKQDDEIVDMFPGSNGMSFAIERLQTETT